MTNQQLIERYPFLQPRNIWTDEIREDYDYSWTRVDEIEEGWQELFLQMCEAIREPLIQANYLERFRFSQLKEKWGHMCCYHFGAPAEVDDIIRKYERLSAKTCIRCGEPAVKKSIGWVAPYCEKCAELLKHTEFELFMDGENNEDNNYYNSVI